MPLYSKKQINNGIVALWQITESFDELLKLVPQLWLDNVDLSKMATHNLAARALAHAVHPEFDILEKDEYGKPYFESATDKISITHTAEFAGFMIKQDVECGIDMEMITPRIKRITAKFIREDEEDYAQLGLKGLYMVWCAKEAMYKLYGQKALDFKLHMQVFPTDISKTSGKLQGRIVKGKYSRDVDMEYELIDEYLLVHTI